MSFALFLLYVALSFLRPFEWGEATLAAYRPMLVLWVLAFLPALFVSLSRREMAARRVHFGLLCAFMVLIVLSSAVRVGGGYALGALSDFSASAMLMVLAVLNLTSLQRLKAACLVVLACVCLLAALGAVSYHTGFAADRLVLRQAIDDDFEEAPPSDGTTVVPAQDTSGRYMWRVRSFGFLNDPNDFAQAMVMVLPFAWIAARRGRRWRNLAVVGVPVAMLGYCTFLTHSRGAIVGIAVMAMVGLRKLIGTVKSAALAAVVVLGVAATAFGGGRAFSTQEQSAGERIEAWWTGINLLKAYPVFGAGYGRFTEHNYLTAHNSFVLCFAELGFAGLYVWMSMIVIAFVGLSIAGSDPRAPRWPQEARMAALLRASMIGTLACSWFLSRTYAPGLYLLFALAIGGWHCADAAARRETGQPLPLPPIPLLALGMSILSIVAVYAFIILQSLGSN